MNFRWVLSVLPHRIETEIQDGHLIGLKLSSWRMKLQKSLAQVLGNCLETLKWTGIVSVHMLSGPHQTKQKEESSSLLRKPKECYLDLPKVLRLILQRVGLWLIVCSYPGRHKKQLPANQCLPWVCRTAKNILAVQYAACLICVQKDLAKSLKFAFALRPNEEKARPPGVLDTGVSTSLWTGRVMSKVWGPF